MLCIDENVAEFVGAFLGDGHTYGKFGRYQVGLVGHKKDDRAFFEELAKTMRGAAGGCPQLRERFRGLRVNNKRLYEFLVKDLGLDYHGEKSYNVTIPEPLLSDWTLTKACLRGLLATDGSIFTARKPGVEKYPSIEITTVSEKLAKQLVTILKGKGFRARIHWYGPKNHAQVRTYKVPL
ncbi:MAG: LAGLIDADG family homing endonuclease, partial [Candidatus Aenigmatarchaeota archaeon]